MVSNAVIFEERVDATAKGFTYAESSASCHRGVGIINTTSLKYKMSSVSSLFRDALFAKSSLGTRFYQKLAGFSAVKGARINNGVSSRLGVNLDTSTSRKV